MNAKRPHTGRRRNDAARRAILETALRLLSEGGSTALSVEALARAAGVGKQTVYRWWPSLSAIVVEALLELARREVRVPDTGSLAADLDAFLTDTYRASRERDTGPALRFLAAEAQAGREPLEALQALVGDRRDALRETLERGARRGQLTAGVNVELALDIAFGVLWYRMLITRERLDDEAARGVAALLASTT